MEELERLRESIKLLLVEGRDERLSDLVEDAHPADVSRVIRELPRDDQVRLFRLLSPQHAGEVLAELDDPTVRELGGSLPEAEVSRVLDRMPPEQVVEELPKERADEILELMEEEKSEEVQELLEYREGTAGRLMSPEFVAVREDANVAEAIEHIRKAASRCTGSWPPTQRRRSAPSAPTRSRACGSTRIKRKSRAWSSTTT